MNRRTFLSTATGATAATTALSFAASPRFLSAAPGTSGASSSSALATHRIDAVEVRAVKVPWPRQVGRNAIRGAHGRGPSPAVCVLRTDQGAMGWGTIQGNRDSVESLRDRVMGKAVGDLFAPTSGILSPDWHPIDLPLHDLAAVILGVPVWKMLGAETPQLTKVYSGMIYFDDLDPEDQPAGIDKVLENCRWDYDYGYRQLKIKIGRGHKWMTPPPAGLRRDIEVVKAIHQAFPDCELLVDGNDGFTVDTIIKFLEGIEGIPLFWIEEPFRETIADWTKLAQWLKANGREKTWRADGEARPDFPVLEALQEDQTLHMHLTDICQTGFTGWRKQMPKLAAAGIAASPHAWGSTLKTVYIAHLAAATGNVPTIEGVTAGQDSSVGFGKNRILNAQFHPSSQPGFGLGLPKV